MGGNVFDTPDAEDGDQDGLKDSEEPNMVGLNGLPYDSTSLDTDGDGYDDFEDYAGTFEDNWITGSHDSEDWSNPGHQH